MTLLCKTEPLTLDLVTYGSDRFDLNLWDDIENKNSIKPKGGLWASTIENDGWRKWCEETNYWGDFDFTKEKFYTQYTGNTVVIDSLGCMTFKLEWERHPTNYDIWTINFEKMLKKGVDAIYLTEKGQYDTHLPEGSASGLYGWDCESIIIMNKNCIKEL